MVKDFQYIELSFINDYEEIKRQIRNTVAISFLFDKGCEKTILNSYLDSTQYGYTASANEKGTNLLVRITDIISGDVNWDLVPHCDCSNEKKYLLSKGDILVARTGGTTGKSFLIKSAPENAIFASYLIRLRTKKNNLPEFISIFLNSYAFWSQISELKSGSAQPNVNAEKLKTLVIPECSPKIQKKVVQILNGEATGSNDSFVNELMTRVNSVISKLDQLESLKKEFNNQQTHLQQFRQTILQEAVQGKLTKQNKDDEPASALLKRIKAEKQILIATGKLKKEKEQPPITKDEIPFELPKGWLWCRLGEVAKQITDGEHITPPRVREGFRLLSAKNVRDGFIDYENCDFVTNKTYEKCIIRCKPEIGDLLIISVGGTIGRTSLITEDIPFVIVRSVAMIKPLIIVSNYLRIVMNSPLLQRIIANKSRGGAQPCLYLNEIQKFVFPLPPLTEQQRIVSKVQQLMLMVNQLTQQVEESQTQAKQLLQAILKEAFTSKGKVYEMNEVLMLAVEE